jgi:hypothetical protein
MCTCVCQANDLSMLTLSGVKANIVALPALTPASAERGSKAAAARKWASTKLFSAGLCADPSDPLREFLRALIAGSPSAAPLARKMRSVATGDQGSDPTVNSAVWAVAAGLILVGAPWHACV